MAAYAVVPFTTSEGSATAVLAALEAKLETLDSTTNAIRLIEVKALPNKMFVGLLIYNG